MLIAFSLEWCDRTEGWIGEVVGLLGLWLVFRIVLYLVVERYTPLRVRSR